MIIIIKKENRMLLSIILIIYKLIRLMIKKIMEKIMITFPDLQILL